MEKEDKEILKGIAKAKELEKLPDTTMEQIVAIYKDGLEEAGKLNKLLKEEWFIRDDDSTAKQKKKSKTPTKKKHLPTRKKKSL